MKTKLKKLFLGLILWIGLLGNGVNMWLVYANGNFEGALKDSTKWIESHLDEKLGWVDDGARIEKFAQKIIAVFFSVMVVVWVLVAMIGFYQILTSSEDSKIKTWVHTLVYWVIWIILMYSAKYLTNVIFENIFNSWRVENLNTTDIISQIYSQMAYPFLKIAIYLSLGILVVLMIVRVFTYITAQDDSTKKKSMWVIAWTTIGMLLITWAKQIVEAVYWQTWKVTQSPKPRSLDLIGSKMLDPEDLPILYNVINWALWLAAFALLVMIIFQTYKLLTKPDDASTFTSLKKTIIYALWGVLLIGAAYLLANLFIIWGD